MLKAPRSALLLLFLTLPLVSCEAPQAPAPAESSASVAAEAPAETSSQETELSAAAAPFRDVAAEVGLDFTHWNGMTGNFYYPEMMGSGAALIDYDNDGDLDVYLVQGSLLGDARAEDAIFPPPAASGDQLFRNELSSGVLSFTNVTNELGLQALGYGMGALAADFDNDGWTDLYVTNLGQDQLWRNLEGKSFVDVTKAAGIDQARWSVPALAVDIDGDNFLDLFLGRYVEWDASTDPSCTDELGLRNYCGPLSFKPLPDALLRGSEGLVFEDLSARAGIRRAFGAALGAAAADFDGDGRLDLYVANDGVPNQLWHREAVKEPRYIDAALLSGTAVSGEGKPEASMGVAVADEDGDGDEDLFLAHLDKETNTLYRNNGAGIFDDASIVSGLGPASRPFTGFGTAFVDYDLDGVLDLMVFNGAVKNIKEAALSGDKLPLRQPNQLFHGLGGGRYELVDGGPAFRLEEVSRGAAFGDLDNDGDPDVVLVNNSGPVRLLLNQASERVASEKTAETMRHWLGLRLTISPAGAARDAWGALAVVRLGDGREVRRRVGDMPSYASSSDPRLLFGLGEIDAVASVEVYWPDGHRESWDEIAVDRYTELRRGNGTPLHGD